MLAPTFVIPGRRRRPSASHPAELCSAGPLEVAGPLGVGAQTLRFLEFVLKDPTRSLLLHDAGIVVPVPEPTRFAVHKLIVAVSRSSPTLAPQNRAKSLKDVLQAESLIEGCEHARLLADLGRAWIEAYTMGPSWRKALREGTLRLSPTHLVTLARSVQEAGALDGAETPFDQHDDPRRALIAATRVVHSPRSVL